MIWIQCFRTGAVGIFFLLLTSWQPATAESQADHIILITSNGWHTGIVIARSDLLNNAIPETADFRDAVYFEFGWGDADYYPASHPTFYMALNAILPGPAVIHVMGLRAIRPSFSPPQNGSPCRYQTKSCSASSAI